MYYPELTQVIHDIQCMIDMCCGENNIAITVNKQMEQLKEYIQTLDPSSVNFSKRDIFNKHKIKAYWDKFLQLADGLNAVIESFGSNERILGNTVATLKIKKDSSKVIIDGVRERQYKEDTTTEGVTQMAVAEQSMQSLDNLINEYSVLLKRVQDIQNVCITAFRQAILIAKTQDSFSEINTVTYESNYRAVKLLLT